jgi:integrase
MKAVLTDKLLRAFAAKGEPHEAIWDVTVRGGFGIRIGKHGVISFFAMRRVRGGSRRPVRITLGRYPLLSLAEARERAQSVLRDLRDGVDPRRREAERLQAEAANRAKQFSAVAEEFLRRHAAHKRTARAIELRIRRELIARWCDRAIDEITRADVVTMVDEIVDRGHRGAAHQTFTYCKRLFNWAIARGTYGFIHSPCDRLNGSDLIGHKQARQRVLTDAELRLIWRATEGAPEAVYPDGPYIRLLLLLGTRRNELARATWSEIDLDQALWIIAPERMKSDHGHVIPLPAVAVDMLRTLPRFASEYVFSARGARPLNDFGAVKKRLDARISKLNGGEPIAPWTFHDARRTFRTGLSTLGIAPHIAELCIGHQQPGLHRTYDLHRFDAEKRDALERWASRLRTIVEPPPANVVPLRTPVSA